MIDIVWDCTDLIDFARRGRPLTGIQRVVVELAKALETTAGVRLSLIRLMSTDNTVHLVKLDDILALEANQRFGHHILRQFGRTTQRILTSLRGGHVVVSDEVEAVLARPDAWVVFPGSSWTNNNFHRIHSALAARAPGLKFAVIVPDMLPIEAPHLTKPRVANAFRQWFDEVSAKCDLMLPLSEATRKLISSDNTSFGSKTVKLVLGVNRFERTPALKPPLLGKEYIVYVSSLIARKNHATAVMAWAAAFADSVERAPHLAFVGHRNPRMISSLRKLVENSLLRQKMHFLSDLSDAEMASVVRNARFFVYPSIYEGWGLPVAEALAMGKFGIVSDSTSLPEVGLDLVDYCPPGDVAAWSAAMRKYAFDRDLLDLREKHIKARCRITTWAESASAIHTALKAASPY